MTRGHRYCALLLCLQAVQAVLFVLYYSPELVIPGHLLPWKTPNACVHTISSPIELEEAENGRERLSNVTGTLGELTNSSGERTNSSVETLEAEKTSPLQQFDTYARHIPNETVALGKFLADQAAVQSIPTEAPGWVYNKTAADLFRKRIVPDSRFANGNFVVTQGIVKQFGLMPHSDVTRIFDVPNEFMKGFPKVSPFENKRFKTCSVVGNGGILKGSGCGKEIDASEFVFRFNMAPMDEKYLEDIGNKTNLITMNPSMIKYRYRKGKGEESTIDVETLMSDLSAYGDSYLWIWAFLSGKHARSALKAQQALQGNNARNQVILPYPIVTRSILSIWRENGIKAHRLSTGLLLVSFATQLCEEVRLYGFWPFHSDRNNRRLTEHYYDNALPGEVHRMPEEFRQLQRLHNTGVLRLTTHTCQ